MILIQLIQVAKKNHPYENCHFFNKKFEKRYLKLPNFDLILLFGILHHLNDTQVKNLYLCKKKMKKDVSL